ncbi:MAG: fluoride efflux transporter CrcB [Planctomycetota bacterium]
MNFWVKFAIVAGGGAAGAVSRFAINELFSWLKLAKPSVESGLPLATLSANLVGCFLIGILFGSGLAEKHPSLKYGFGVGFLGALTTFSTFSAESIEQIQSGQSLMAIAYMVISLAAGLLLVFLGMLLGKRWLG